MSTGAIALIIILITLVLMVLQVFPIEITALLSAFTMAAFGLITPKEILAQYGTNTFFCVPGMMIVGGAVFKTGLAQRIGAVILRKNHSEKKLIVILIFSVTLVSAFFSNTTCTAMFLPLAASAAYFSKGSITKKNTYMCIGFAATLGGCGTLVGSPSQHLLAQEILESNGFEPMGFFHGVPATVVMMALMILYFVTFGYKLENKVLDFPEVESPEPESVTVTKINYKMIMSGIILVACVICIATGVVGSGEGALIGAALVVATRCISPKDAVDSVSWPVCVMLGALFAMTHGFNNSGAGDLIVSFVIRTMGENASPMLIFALAMFVAGMLTNILDNIATQALLGTTYLALATHYGINVTTMLYGLLFACNLAYLTPIGTPSVAMTLSGGYRFSDYIKIGFPLWIIAFLFIVFGIPLIYGLYA